MRTVRIVLAVVVLALVGIFGFTYANNPQASMTSHASVVGYAVANPFSGKAWRGLACPHRTVVTDLVTKSLGPKLCGTSTDGGASARAERFRTEGPTSCWALFETLNNNSRSRFAAVLSGEAEPGPAAQDVCRQAKKLIEG